jgi:XTP/dITP diphosphohydrolase
LIRNIKEIIAATRNEGKLREIKEILKDFNLKILSLKDFNDIQEIDETGFSFYENSLIKAKTVYNITKIPTLADDSGLCVEFLDGMPGIFSARFAGSSKDPSGGNTDDNKNNEKLLGLMKGLKKEDRRAYFKCAMVFVYGADKFISASGKMEGYIAESQKGENGFGYDSIFYLPQYDMTSAEISPEEKNKISHRYKALMELKRHLEDI